MTWWLRASAAELDMARTCRRCGSKDADIDLGLCFVCFSDERERERDRRRLDDAERRIAELEAELTAREKSHA